MSSVSPTAFAPILSDLGVEARRFEPGGDSCIAAGRAPALLRIGREGWALALVEGPRSEPALAQLRNELWPALHVVALFQADESGVHRETLQGRKRIGEAVTFRGMVLAARRREEVLSPTATVSKFDTNAGGWNGEPGQPGYAHFRWMRRYVALFAQPKAGARVLDFGCGAGWVGIEAARAAGNAELAAFDPSPEMVRNAEKNARESGISRFVGRTGFGEDPPFSERFPTVLSSGVVSFSPDHERWFDGLARCCESGGTLVIGDLNPASRGMEHRRATRPLLPARELNALTAEAARAQLERRGFVHECTAGYQLTRPVPQLAHWSDTKLHGALSPILLAWNRLRAGPTSDLGAFDSWVQRFRAP